MGIPPFKETPNYHFTWQISQPIRFSHHPRFGSVMLLYTLRSGASTPDRRKTKTKCGPRILKRNTWNVGKLSFCTSVFSKIQSIFVCFLFSRLFFRVCKHDGFPDFYEYYGFFPVMVFWEWSVVNVFKKGVTTRTWTLSYPIGRRLGSSFFQVEIGKGMESDRLTLG